MSMSERAVSAIKTFYKSALKNSFETSHDYEIRYIAINVLRQNKNQVHSYFNFAYCENKLKQTKNISLP